MRDPNNISSRLVAALFFLLLASSSTFVHAQTRMTIQAIVQGTSTQLGQIYHVNIIIQQFSTPEDQKALLDAFESGGQDKVVSVLEDMKPKGQVRFASGGVGNDIKYIIELPSDKGRRIRLITDRNIGFGELYNGTRSRDYSVGAIELVLTPDGKGTGTVLPAVKLTEDKKTKQIELETFQNPWNLTNVVVHNDDK